MELSPRAAKLTLSFFFCSISTCLSMCLRGYFRRDLGFNPLDFMLITLVLFSLIAMYQWLSFRLIKVKMPRMIFHLISSFFTLFVVILVREWVLIAVGAIASSCMMMDASGAGASSASPSTSWEKYLNFSGEDQENPTPEHDAPQEPFPYQPDEAGP